MKKKLLLLAGILALGATTFAAEIPATPSPVTPEDAVETITATGDQNEEINIDDLALANQESDGSNFSGSYSNGVHWRAYQGPSRSNKEANGNYSNTGNRLQYNLGSGKLNFGDLGFTYSVSRYDYFNKNWNKTFALTDTFFGLDYKVGTFDALGKEWSFDPTISFEYDKYDDFSTSYKDPSQESYEAKRLIEVTPRLRTNYLGFAATISPSIAYDDRQGTVGYQLAFSMSRSLNDNWSYSGTYYLDLRGTRDDKMKEGTDVYTNSLYTGNIGENQKYAFSTEQYIYYTKAIVGNLYFKNTFALESYSLLQSDSVATYIYTIPQVQYQAKLGDWNVTPYISYFLGSNQGFSDSNGKNQLRGGVTFGTSF